MATAANAGTIEAARVKRYRASTEHSMQESPNVAATWHVARLRGRTTSDTHVSRQRAWT
jgi:hypothetical protein